MVCITEKGKDMWAAGIAGSRLLNSQELSPFQLVLLFFFFVELHTQAGPVVANSLPDLQADMLPLWPPKSLSSIIPFCSLLDPYLLTWC